MSGINGVGYSNDNLKVFPNPAGDYVYISLAVLNEASTMEINVYDQSGRKVQSKEFENSKSQFRVETSDLSPGIYFLEIVGLNGILAVEKLMIE